MRDPRAQIEVLDYAPREGRFFEDVMHGLQRQRKELPCKYFYDDRGSELFEHICDLEEYYLTRAELAIMKEHAGEMAAELGPGCLLIEYGSGTSRKTRILLDHLESPVAYVPIDISRQTLAVSAASLASAYPTIQVVPICADYTESIHIPERVKAGTRRVIYFPGSTIGNFSMPEAQAFLAHARSLVGAGGALLIGVDLKKDPRVLEAAYDDRDGVTAAFNKNLLVRMNRELGADFHLDRFRHQASYNRERARVEMHLVSLDDQRVRINGEKVFFRKGESIRTECSYKYDLESFGKLTESVGFAMRRMWIDPDRLFSVHYLTV
ncbi:MAG: L-histidine N(alpha)-methyltransferase [Acidobacteriota bacterium]